MTCFRFRPCTMPVLRMLWSGREAKDSAWQRQWNRQALIILTFVQCSLILCFRGTFVHILPFDPHHRTGRPSCFDFLDDETKFRAGTDILNKDDCWHWTPLFCPLQPKKFSLGFNCEVMHPNLSLSHPLLCRASVVPLHNHMGFCVSAQENH